MQEGEIIDEETIVVVVKKIKKYVGIEVSKIYGCLMLISGENGFLLFKL